MRKRDDAKSRRETMHALAMILQIALAVMTCMGMSLAIGYYIDRLFRTSIWVPIMMFIGILAAIRSMLVLAGKFTPKSMRQSENASENLQMEISDGRSSEGTRTSGRGQINGDSEKKPD